ncbi:MAG: biotin transporter BioY [Pseudomonadota bacterium]
MPSTSRAGANTLAEILPSSRAAAIGTSILIAIVGSLLMTLAAKYKIPFEPVAMTLQPFVVLLLGLTLGARLAGGTIALYLSQGAMGLPVFTGTPEKGIGLAYMMGPTGGFLAGFFIAAVVVGMLADRGWSRSVFMATLAAIIGLALLYLPGITWLAGWLSAAKGTALSDAASTAITVGAAPFIAKDLLAAVIAALMVATGWSLAKQRRRKSG